MMNDFLMSRDWFDVALASTDNKQKKAREEEKTIEEEDVRKTHQCLLKKRYKHCDNKNATILKEKIRPRFLISQLNLSTKLNTVHISAKYVDK